MQNDSYICSAIEKRVTIVGMGIGELGTSTIVKDHGIGYRKATC